MLILSPVQGAKSSAPAVIIQETYETTGWCFGACAQSRKSVWRERFRVSQSCGCVVYACALLFSKNGETI
jgi:hypothetical protein